MENIERPAHFVKSSIPYKGEKSAMLKTFLGEPIQKVTPSIYDHQPYTHPVPKAFEDENMKDDDSIPDLMILSPEKDKEEIKTASFLMETEKNDNNKPILKFNKKFMETEVKEMVETEVKEWSTGPIQYKNQE